MIQSTSRHFPNMLWTKPILIQILLFRKKYINVSFLSVSLHLLKKTMVETLGLKTTHNIWSYLETVYSHDSTECIYIHRILFTT